ncbi:MAG: MerR family transcriptional regulator [Saprospiraceae bacterium]|nr:MerR family transcriptional regulator [Saprospiraceae bacterium]MCB0679249.1 MerR family transcriptional regulator [Saprospiraceae bacterium]MCB0682114.1 MerR family transcriptional regulator [Saprospiraceae bacterium]
MAVYSIKDLEKLSGVKAHTIRIWEQRYGIINPRRTPTNIRYYQDDDLKFLLNIALLNKNGIKISKIANMSKDEVAEKVAAISDINSEYGTQLDALTISMIEMDEMKFDRIISTNIQQLGFERTMLEVILPFLDKLGVLWLTGSINPVQENFISYLIRQKLIVAIDAEPLAQGETVKKFLIYLPEGERQELSLLFMHYLLKVRGHQVLYIGQDMSVYDLKDIYKVHRPDFIFTMISETFAREPVQQYVDTLSTTFPDARILLTGYQVVAQDVPTLGNVRVLKSLEQTLQFLDQLA